MLLCGILEDLEKTPGENSNLGYFFCQAMDYRINSASSVVGGLIHSLVKKNPTFFSPICKQYENISSQLDGVNQLDRVNPMVVLSDIFEAVTHVEGMPGPVCVVDALDECVQDCKLLLDLIIRTSNHVKWLLSSRNDKDVEQGLRVIEPAKRIPLELKGNAENVSKSVDAYINNSISGIQALEYDEELQIKTTTALKSKANGTFLWVAPKIEELRFTDRRDVEEALEEIPEGLESLYIRIIQRANDRLSQKDQEACQILLSIVATAERPLNLEELRTFISSQRAYYKSSYDILDIKDMVGDCGSILTIRDDVIYFIHPSVKDFIIKEYGTYSIDAAESNYVGSEHLNDSIFTAESIYAAESVDTAMSEYVGAGRPDDSVFTAESIYAAESVDTEVSEDADTKNSGPKYPGGSTLTEPVYAAESVYTADSNIPRSKKEAYISSFANDLLSRIVTEKLHDDSIDIIDKALPKLLKTFALKLGSVDSKQIYGDVMIFVRKYRNEITQAMKDIYTEERDNHNDIPIESMFEDRIENWSLDMDNLEDPNTALNEDPENVMSEATDRTGDEIKDESIGNALDNDYSEDLEATNQADEDIESLPEISIYTKFLLELPVYQWLLDNIRKSIYMDIPGSVQASIRNSILKFIAEPQKVSRRVRPQKYNFKFTVAWDPCLFLYKQEYLERPETAIERAITVTGSGVNAQAATIKQYLSQMWPSSGIYLLGLLKLVVQEFYTRSYSNDLPQGSLPQDSLPDGTQLKVLSPGPHFTLQVIGISESIVEIGEQLAWIASALHSSPSQQELVLVEAHVEIEKLIKESNAEYSCNIRIVETPNTTTKEDNGQCWHHLFQNRAVVKGYSIPRRPTHHAGLEINLDAMAALVGTNRINLFNNKIFIKGFSAMMVPTEYADGILLWHLLYNTVEDHISYFDSKISHLKDMDLPSLGTRRHILGTATAEYKIKNSGLPDLRGSEIIQGKRITSNYPAAVPQNSTRYLVSEVYRKRLDRLSKKYVIFWDNECKRGWLVNGARALLHLLRASLEFDKKGVFAFMFRFESEKFEQIESPNAVSAAIQTLWKSDNLNLELYVEDERDGSNANIKYLVRDRINDLLETLDQIIEYQEGTKGDGELPEYYPRKYLKGWDFTEIATTEPRIKPRLAKIKTVGKGWVDFTRTIKAATLFGQGFGELIQPAPESEVCGHWKNLPLNKYYLAANMDDLGRIMDRWNGDPTANPPRLTKSQAWVQSKIEASLRCNCDTSKRCELAQTILPLRMINKNTEKVCLPVGAVVFGHNPHWGKIWNDTGDPQVGKPPLVGEESDGDDTLDSGVGPSIFSNTVSEQNDNTFDYKDYKIGIICALPKELMAVRLLLDDIHQGLRQAENDNNAYILGSIGMHNVVAVCLPYAEPGTNAAAKVASDMEKTFSALKWYFLVGIGGGIPSKYDIRLGDVVVSTGIIQHDMGKTIQNGTGFQPTAFIKQPSQSLRTAMSMVQSDPGHDTDSLETHIQQIARLKQNYKHPGKHLDKLFKADSYHKEDQPTCDSCDGHVVNRNPKTREPKIHYGIIASGNQVIKDAKTRDRIGNTTGAICVEMEAAGVMMISQCLVIRGICDYADSHKNDDWHHYAAAAAAAYLKYFLQSLSEIPSSKWPAPTPEEYDVREKQTMSNEDVNNQLATINHGEMNSKHAIAIIAAITLTVLILVVWIFSEQKI
ncbi:hypothetical protein J3E68DRAFT_272313 [Trichoderma sp. SZMC 28012]